MNGFALIALHEYSGFSEALSKTAALEMPDRPADHGITGWPGIMAGVLWQARWEAEMGERSAIEWLKSDDCYEFCQAINFNHRIVMSWLDKKKYTRKKKGL